MDDETLDLAVTFALAVAIVILTTLHVLQQNQIQELKQPQHQQAEEE